MPELPEVETTRLALKNFVIQQVIKSVTLRQLKLRWPIPADLDKKLHNKTVLDLTRMGKYLLFHFQNGALLLHLGMSGRLHFHQEPCAPGAHDHVDIHFQNGTFLRFTDPRRFGALLWTEAPFAEHKLLKHLGIEPLIKTFNAAYLFEQTRRRKLPIKSLLMDSKVIVGIGNIYAQEALFEAGIKPTKAAGLLTLAQSGRLVKAIQSVLKKALKSGGTTFRDFRSPDGSRGYFSLKLKVYGKEGLPCSVCASTLKTIRMSGRSTVYCNFCQK
ncbi:MAG: bifunctional DNA-formamidopyrimidine glycosylase/DNA-(apurinic or apyrimidinic site) lyase [Gammaproteobacteria bacterium]|nr:bifunctional DNA-formamidopyrimidine glycosylase/DNA-(apurinic or apyrimidinic site) lyase [Gammaproteobacteria bacterium]